MNEHKMELEEAITILEATIGEFKYLQSTLDEDERELYEHGIQTTEIQAIQAVLQALEEAKKECNFIRKDDDYYIIYGCSNCNEEWYFEDGTPKDNQYNYCPKCGAKIKKVIELEEDEEDY